MRAGFQFDQGEYRLAVAACAGKASHRYAVHPAIVAKGQQGINGAAFKGAVEGVSCLEGEAGRLMPVAGAGAHPAFFADDDGDGVIDHEHFGHGFFLFLDQRAARIGKLFGILLDFFDHQAPQARGAVQDVFKFFLLQAQLLELLFYLDGLQTRQLTQADFQDVFSLPVAELEARHQRRLGFVTFTNDGDDCIDVEQHDLPPFEDVDAIQYFAQPVLTAAGDGLLAEGDPFLQHLAQRFLHGFAIQANCGQVDGNRCFKAGMGQQGVDQFVLAYSAAFGLEHDAYQGIFARFVAHAVEHRKHAGLELQLVLCESLLAGFDLGIGQRFDFFQYLLRAHIVRKFRHHQLPLAAGQIFDSPACAYLETAAPGAVGVCNVGAAADDLAATGKIRSRNQGKQFLIGELGVLYQRHTGIGHLAQVVAGDFGGHAHGNAAGAIEQGKRQACRQLRRLFGAAVVVGHKIDRSHVEFVGQ